VPVHTGSHQTVTNTMEAETSTIGPHWKASAIEVGVVGKREERWKIKKTGDQRTGDRGY
jgi:hypothetical protein